MVTARLDVLFEIVVGDAHEIGVPEPLRVIEDGDDLWVSPHHG